jgi:hypothetical protein
VEVATRAAEHRPKTSRLRVLVRFFAFSSVVSFFSRKRHPGVEVRALLTAPTGSLALPPGLVTPD